MPGSHSTVGIAVEGRGVGTELGGADVGVAVGLHVPLLLLDDAVSQQGVPKLFPVVTCQVLVTWLERAPTCVGTSSQNWFDLRYIAELKS